MEDELGQIVVAVSDISLRFKNPNDANGQVFVTCKPIGRGASIFLPSAPADGVEGGHASVSNGASTSPSSPLPKLSSDPVEIVTPESNEAAASDIACADDDDVDGGRNSAVAESAATQTTVVNVNYTLISTKFEITEQNLSLLEVTEVDIAVSLRAIGSGDGADVVVGNVTVRIADILRGHNAWGEALGLGTRNAAVSDAPMVSPDGDSKGNADDTKVDGIAEEDGLVSKTVEDTSPGPLEFGGSTSTLRVALTTDDDTADYTVGAGSLWTDGADITGVPEGWTVQPPPGTERSGWNDAIAHTLAGETCSLNANVFTSCGGLLWPWL